MNTTTANSPPVVTRPLATPIDKGEAPGEWASSTLSALGPVTTEQYPADKPFESQKFIHNGDVAATTNTHPFQPSSTATTPGVLPIPGAFPSTALGPGILGQDTQHVKEAAANALETARVYAVSAGESAKGYAATAGETVSGFLPASVAAYLPASVSRSTPSNTTDTSLPSTEVGQNYTPSSAGGVGTLPGPPGEIGVAVLPEERLHEDPLAASAKPSSSSTYSTSSTSDQNALEYDPIDPTVRRNSLARSQFTPAGRALAVEAHALPSTTHTSTRSLAGSRAPGADDYVEDAEEQDDHGASSSSAKPDSQEQAQPRHKSHPRMPAPAQAQMTPIHTEVPVTNARDHALAGDEADKLGRGERAGDSMLATPGHDAPAVPEKDTIAGPPAGTSATAAVAAIAHGGTPSNGVATSETSPVKAAGANGHTASTATPTKKPGFMDKVRGEMKILSGKLEHSEAKIAEGRRMMGKDADPVVN